MKPNRIVPDDNTLRGKREYYRITYDLMCMHNYIVVTIQNCGNTFFFDSNDLVNPNEYTVYCEFYVLLIITQRRLI